jgi:hypothetical protein
VWSGLRKDAAHQRLPLDRLSEHAAIGYLADLDGAHLAARAFELSEEEE